LYEEWIDGFTLCPVLSVPSDDLDFVLNAGHLDLITEKILDKLQGREEVVFDNL
jgi:deoxyadenosine/deoxycytidine kinase